MTPNPPTVAELENSLIDVLNRHQRALREVSRLKAILEEHEIPFGPTPEYRP